MDKVMHWRHPTSAPRFICAFHLCIYAIGAFPFLCSFPKPSHHYPATYQSSASPLIPFIFCIFYCPCIVLIACFKTYGLTLRGSIFRSRNNGPFQKTSGMIQNIHGGRVRELENMSLIAEEKTPVEASWNQAWSVLSLVLFDQLEKFRNVNSM